MKRFTAEMSDKMQFFLDEEGQADLVAVTERTGAKLEISYKGAHGVAPCGRDRRGRIRGRQEPPRQGQAPDDLRRRRTALHRTRTAARTRTFGRRRRRRSRTDTPSGGGASAGAQGGSGNGADNRAVGGSNGDAADRGAIDAAALSGGVGSAVSSGANSATAGPAFAPASSGRGNSFRAGRSGRIRPCSEQVCGGRRSCRKG